MLNSRWLRLLSILALVFTTLGVVSGAELVDRSAGVYRLPEGETLDDDLYVAATEIYINGTLNGDLNGLATYVEINGEVLGDVAVVASGVSINGRVADDVQTATGAFQLNGTIGDELFGLLGGNPLFNLPFTVNGNTLEQGGHLAAESEIEGDVTVAGGFLNLLGQIGGDTIANVQGINLAGRIAGDATLDSAIFTVDNSARVGGVLSYATPDTPTIPDAVTDQIERREWQTQDENSQLIQTMLLRIVGLLAGYGLIGWALMRYAPMWVIRPAAALTSLPNQAAQYGCLSLLLPVIFLGVALLLAFFWGAGILLWLGLATLSFFALIWYFSPLITGLWFGQRFSDQPLTALLIGTSAIILLSQVPVLGFLVMLLSFLLGLGSLVLARNMARMSNEQ